MNQSIAKIYFNPNIPYGGYDIYIPDGIYWKNIYSAATQIAAENYCKKKNLEIIESPWKRYN